MDGLGECRWGSELIKDGPAISAMSCSVYPTRGGRGSSAHVHTDKEEKRGRIKDERITKTTYNKRLIMCFQLLQPPTCPRIGTHQRTKRKLIHCVCIFLVIRWSDEWFHDQPPPKVNPIDTVFTPCPRHVEGGRPGIWTGVVVEWVCGVRYPWMGLRIEEKEEGKEERTKPAKRVPVNKRSPIVHRHGRPIAACL